MIRIIAGVIFGFLSIHFFYSMFIWNSFRGYSEEINYRRRWHERKMVILFPILLILLLVMCFY